MSLTKGDLAEVIINEQTIGSARVNGTLDHIHKDGTRLVISDYKTGKPLTSFSTKDQTKAIKAWRQRTQLLFYCLLAKHSGRFKNVSDLQPQIIYLEADNEKQLMLSLSPSEDELARTANLVEAVWKRIEILDFPIVNKYEATIDGITAFENDLLK